MAPEVSQSMLLGGRLVTSDLDPARATLWPRRRLVGIRCFDIRDVARPVAFSWG